MSRCPARFPEALEQACRTALRSGILVGDSVSAEALSLSETCWSCAVAC